MQTDILDSLYCFNHIGSLYNYLPHRRRQRSVFCQRENMWIYLAECLSRPRLRWLITVLKQSMWKVTLSHQNKQTSPNMEYLYGTLECLFLWFGYLSHISALFQENCWQSVRSVNKSELNTRYYPNTQFYVYKEIERAVAKAHEILSRKQDTCPFVYGLRVLADVQVGRVSLNHKNERMSDIFCLPILSSTTLSQLFLARVNFLLSSSSIVW